MVGTNLGKCEWVWKEILWWLNLKIANFKNGRIQDGCQYQFRWEWLSLSQIELVWVSIRVEWECFWVNLREDNKVSEFNMAEFKMAAIIKLNQNEWVKLFVQNGWILDGRILDDCHHQVESEWMSEVFLCKWWEPILASVSEFERKYYDGWIQDGQIQDGCHHSSWVRINEWSFLFKVAESNMVEF